MNASFKLLTWFLDNVHLPSEFFSISLYNKNGEALSIIQRLVHNRCVVFVPTGKKRQKDLALKNVTNLKDVQGKLGLFCILVNKATEPSTENTNLTFFVVARFDFTLNFSFQLMINTYGLDLIETMTLEMLNAKVKELISATSSEMNVFLSLLTSNIWLPDFVASFLSLNFDEKFEFFKLESFSERTNKALELMKTRVDLNEYKIVDKMKIKLTTALMLNSKFANFFNHITKLKNYSEDSLDTMFTSIPLLLERKNDETTKLKTEIDNLNVSDSIKKTLISKLNGASRSVDFQVFKSQLEYIISLPWNIQTKDEFSLSKLKAILDSEHYGLTEVKKRITEYFIIHHMSKGLAKAPILCLVGPAGVGKTTLACSIAKSLNRKFFKISLCGVHDQSVLKGHRVAYVGAQPGQIINALKVTGVNNPVILLDEIDKMNNQNRFDATSSLLEILDPEQNAQFTDLFVNIPFDLSKVLFICTANNTGELSTYIKDRMEILILSHYKLEEKVIIALKYLIPKKIIECGLEDLVKIEFNDESLREVIRFYTAESGVRELTRVIDTICRDIAVRKFSESNHENKEQNKKAIEVSIVKETINIDVEYIQKVLGDKKFDLSDRTKINRSGVAIGMCVAGPSGATMVIESTKSNGKGQLITTGRLGKTLEESARLAYSWFKMNHIAFGVPPENVNNYDIHIHYSNLVTKKDGPSATITTAITILSLFTGQKVEPGLAMTGEMTLHGYILPVGGIEEKVTAAYNDGIRMVILPEKNRKDAIKMDLYGQNVIDFHFAKTFDEVILVAFGGRIPVAAYLNLSMDICMKSKL